MRRVGIGSYTELARKLNWSSETLRHVREGKHVPSVYRALELARALNVPVEWLYGCRGAVQELEPTTLTIEAQTRIVQEGKAIAECRVSEEKSLELAISHAEYIVRLCNAAFRLGEAKKITDIVGLIDLLHQMAAEKK